MTGLTPITSKNSRDTLLPGIIVVSLPIRDRRRPRTTSAPWRETPRVPRFQSSKLGSDAVTHSAPAGVDLKQADDAVWLGIRQGRRAARR